MAAEATTFEDVASKIANGNPPPWLLTGLNYFSKFIQLEPKLTSKEDREIDEEMLKAARYLTKWLPTYYDLEKNLVLSARSASMKHQTHCMNLSKYLRRILAKHKPAPGKSPISNGGFVHLLLSKLGG